MQKASDVKTASARKRWPILFGFVVFGILPFIFHPAITILKVNDQSFILEVASSTAEQEKGLGYRKSLPNNHGMVFVFSKAEVQCFWMKGMEFQLDIIWLNSYKQVVFMNLATQPDSYPHSFCPNVPAQYVIELNAGQVGEAGIADGQTLSF